MRLRRACYLSVSLRYAYQTLIIQMAGSLLFSFFTLLDLCRPTTSQIPKVGF